MADEIRHYGLDVKVAQVGSVNILAAFESIDFKISPTVKESQAAQDTGPNKRVVGEDYSVTVNKFVGANNGWLLDYIKSNGYENINLTFTFTLAGSGPNGGVWKTLTILNAICSDGGFNISGDATKETFEFQRGTGGSFTFS